MCVVPALPLECAECIFDRHKVWGVWRQEHQFAFCILDDLFRFWRFVEGGVVDDDDHARLQARNKLSLQPQVERVRIACALEQERCGEFFVYQSCDQTGAWPTMAGAEAVDALATHGVAVVSLRRALKAGFIDIDKRTALLCQLVMALEITATDVCIVQRFSIPPRFFYG